MKNKKNAPACDPQRLGKVGGQAVIEGVMMKAGDRTVTTCRKEDGTLIVSDDTFVSARTKHKILDLPLVRGVVNFIEMMSLSLKTMERSAEALGIEEEEETKFEAWMKKHLGLKITDFVMIVGSVLGVALSLLLFMYLPALISSPVSSAEHPVLKSLIEGGAKVVIFLSYLYLISLIPDIRRVFMYHGAEHKSIACYEAGAELTPENAKNYTRFHPRCGTSFMFFMILVGIVVGIFINVLIPGLVRWQYVLIRLCLLPLVVGIGYEFIRYAGKHENFLTKTLSAPGLWVQRLTTKEPDLSMLEVAITSVKVALRETDPAFMAFYEARAWETATPETEADATENEAPAEAADMADTTETEAPSEVAETADAPQDSDTSENADA